MSLGFGSCRKEKMTEVSGKRGGRTVEGTIVKSRNDKTRIVEIDQSSAHRIYGRRIRRIAKFVAHDENNESNVGDVVRILESRPLSRTKRWRLVEVVKTGQVGK